MLLFASLPFQRRRCGRCWHTAARLRWRCRASACTSRTSWSSTTAPRPSSSAPSYRAPSSANRKWSTAARSRVSSTPKVGTLSLSVGLHWQLWYFTPRCQMDETCPWDDLKWAPLFKCEVRASWTAGLSVYDSDFDLPKCYAVGPIVETFLSCSFQPRFALKQPHSVSTTNYKTSTFALCLQPIAKINVMLGLPKYTNRKKLLFSLYWL